MRIFSPADDILKHPLIKEGVRDQPRQIAILNVSMIQGRISLDRRPWYFYF